jgi:hypothetical protein
VAKAAKILHEKRMEFARIMTLEMGKRISEALGEVDFSSRILAYYAKNAEKFLAPVKLHPTHGEAPYGKQSDRRDLLRRTLELSLLPAGARRRSASDGRQHDCRQTCRYRAAMRDCIREIVD